MQLEVQQGGPEDLGTEGRSGALEPDGVGLGRTLKVQWNFPGRHGWRAEKVRKILGSKLHPAGFQTPLLFPPGC